MCAQFGVKFTKAVGAITTLDCSMLAEKALGFRETKRFRLIIREKKMSRYDLNEISGFGMG